MRELQKWGKIEKENESMQKGLNGIGSRYFCFGKIISELYPPAARRVDAFRNCSQSARCVHIVVTVQRLEICIPCCLFMFFLPGFQSRKFSCPHTHTQTHRQAHRNVLIDNSLCVFSSCFPYYLRSHHALFTALMAAGYSQKHD